MMIKNILLSSAVVVLLGLGGCGSDTTTTATPAVTSKALDSVKSMQRSADAKYVAAWAKDAGVELAIAGGADASMFEIENSNTGSILKFKNDVYPEYVEGGDNEYIVEVNAKDTVKNLTRRVGTYKIKVPRPSVIGDTTAPTITTPNSFSLAAGSATTLTANETVTFSLLQANGFTLTDAMLRAPDTASNYTVRVQAEDTSGNKSQKDLNIIVTVQNNQQFEIDDVDNNRTTWLEAEAACSAKGMGWRLPTITELQENNATIFDNITSLRIDSDFNLSNNAGVPRFDSVIWSTTPVVGMDAAVQGLWYKDGNVSGTQVLDRMKTDTSFRLCVRP